MLLLWHGSPASGGQSFAMSSLAIAFVDIPPTREAAAVVGARGAPYGLAFL
jgi:hypothetical protein